MRKELEWEDSQKSAEEHAPTTTPSSCGATSDNTDNRKRGALVGSHNTVLLAVLSGGSAVGGKTDALAVSLLLVPGNLIAAAVRKRRRRLQRVHEAIERCRCAHDVHSCFLCTTFLNSRFACGCCVSMVFLHVGTGRYGNRLTSQGVPL